MKRIQIDTYIIDTLMRDVIGHDRQPSAFIIYLYLWSRTLGLDEKSAHVSLQTLSDNTGLSKSAVQGAMGVLLRRRLIRVSRTSKTSTPEYFVHRPWAERNRGPSNER